MRPRSLCLLAPVLLAASGCNLSQFSTPSQASSALPAISGSVHGGQQPIAGATIQLYAANTATTQGAATPLLTSPVLTSSTGAFSITGTYTCPSASALVYVVATGGNPGLNGSVNNTAIAEMTVLGTCGSLTASTFISINELTTVAAVEALAPFMLDYAHVGATSVTSLNSAFLSVTTVVDPASGQLVPSPAAAGGLATLYNTLANILASCVNTAGGAAGSATPCGQLFLNTTNPTATPQDTILAMLHIVQLPGQNVAALFNLATAAAPFQPMLSLVPANFIAAAGVTLPSLPWSNNIGAPLAIDSTDQIWVYEPSLNPYTQSDGGTLYVFANDGTLRHTITPGTGGMGLVLDIAADRFGNVWTLNHNHTLSKFNSAGVALSPAAGFPTDPYDTTQASPNSFNSTLLAIDPSGNVWLPSALSCFSKYSPSGVNITPAGNFCTGIFAQGGFYSVAVTSDAAGGVFLEAEAYLNNAVQLVLAHVDANGNQVTVSPLMPPPSTMPYRIEYDPVFAQVWALSLPIGTNAVPAVIAVRSDGTSVTPAAGIPLPIANASISTDGAGRIWQTSNSSTPILNEIDHNGTLLSPYTALHPAVMTSPATSAIDSSGNIWITNVTLGFPTADSSIRTLIKVQGFAAGKPYQ